MNTAELASPYESPLREAQKAATRERILKAAHELMADRGLAELSYAAVAKGAGVQERTVYRHFPNKGALLDAIRAWFDSRLGAPPHPTSEADLIKTLPRVFVGLDANENFIRAMRVSPIGAESRQRSNKNRQAVFRGATADATRGLSKREAEWLAATAQLLYSSAAWQSMKDHWGYSGEEAGKACAFAIELLFEAARRRADARIKSNKAKG